MKKLPVGLQDFENIRKNNFLYVDKTKQILDLIEEGKYIFFSRPRRFGKSLLCSTLKYLYEGRRDLFEGLYIADKIDWELLQRSVIHIDFSESVFDELPLSEAMQIQMKSLGNSLGIQIINESAVSNFQHFIQTLAKSGKKPVVIVDEYDKALTDYLGDKERFEENKNFLRGFYGILKPNDKNLHQVFITGVSKYGKISVFSQMNNILDCSLFDQYATMCGYTRSELEYYFEEYIVQSAKKFDLTKELLLKQIQYKYNGYSFDGINKLYNPFSILCFFKANQFKNYWFETGTPYFLLELLQKQKIKINELEGFISEPSILDIADIQHQNPIALLFQTGYLTIKKVIQNGIDTYLELDFPNTEVKQSFSQYLLTTYIDKGLDKIANNISWSIKEAFETLDFEKLYVVLVAIYADIPYQLFQDKEAYYHTIFHVVMNATGLKTQSEVQTNIGRIDTVIENNQAIFIFEFKLDEK